MKSIINTATGRTTIFEDEGGVHVHTTLKNGQVWEAGMFTLSKTGDTQKAWGAALELARSIMTQAPVMKGGDL